MIKLGAKINQNENKEEKRTNRYFTVFHKKGLIV